MEYRGLTLDSFQQDAIAALEAGHPVLVSAPTGTGKTVVADWAVERALAAGKEVVYTAPIKALSNQKFRDYCKMLGEDRVGLVTGDLVIRPDAPVRVMTTEILRNMLLTGQDVSELTVVVIDEIHFLDDLERGTTWEELLIYLPPHVQVVGLSATIANLDEFAEWLGFVRDRPVTVVVEHQRAVPLATVVATQQGKLIEAARMPRFYKDWARKNGGAAKPGKHRGRAQKGRRSQGRRGQRERMGHPTRHTDVFRMLHPELAPYLYFTFSRRDAENMARSLSHRLERPLLNKERFHKVNDRLTAFHEDCDGDDPLDRELRRMYLAGIAFHHAGLHVRLKALVEELYEQRLVDVLYCTGTFALGINMPARTAVFDGLRRFDGTKMIPLPGREFMQMAGRAGRRGLDDEGLVVVRTHIDDWPDIEAQVQGYMRGRIEPVRSRFSLSFHSVVNLVQRHPPARIRALVERSFLAFHRSRSSIKDTEDAVLLEASLRERGWEEGQPHAPGLKKDIRRFRKLRTRSLESNDETWNEFEDRVRFLTHWGYLAEDGRFNAGGRVLLDLQIAEIFASELFLSGIFDDLDPETVFGVCTGMVASLPKGAFAPKVKSLKGVLARIGRIRASDMVLDAEEMTRQRVSWDPGYVVLGRMWAQGRPLAEISQEIESQTDLSGAMVGAFRRGKDLLSQLRDVYKNGGLEDRADALHAMMKSVKRDEVEVVD